MRRLLYAMCVSAYALCVPGCARPTIQLAVDPDAPKMYELHLHDHDLVCAVDASAPNLQSCMTFAEFQGFLHSVRAEVEP